MIRWTYELAMAAGWDAATRRMRKQRRSRWNVGDFNLAVKVFSRLFPETPEERRCSHEHHRDIRRAP